MSLRHLSDEIIKPMCEKHGLRWAGLYGARRGAGTHLFQIGVSIEYIAKFLGNTISVVEAAYVVDKGEASAKAAEQDRQHRLVRAQQAQVAPGLTEQKQLPVSVNDELAALALGEGGAL